MRVFCVDGYAKKNGLSLAHKEANGNEIQRERCQATERKTRRSEKLRALLRCAEHVVKKKCTSEPNGERDRKRISNSEELANEREYKDEPKITHTHTHTAEKQRNDRFWPGKLPKSTHTHTHEYEAEQNPRFLPRRLDTVQLDG